MGPCILTAEEQLAGWGGTEREREHREKRPET